MHWLRKRGNSAAALQMKVDYLATKPVDLEELKRAVQPIAGISRKSGQGNEKQ